MKPVLELDPALVRRARSLARKAGKPVVKLATWPQAWTPASVRPATVRPTGSRSTVASAVSSSPWTLRRPGWTAQPLKPEPS